MTTDDDDAMAGYATWKEWGQEKFGQFSRGKKRYFTWHLARCHPQPILHALEIGFGNGAFMGFANARGITIVGTEIQDELRQRATAAGFAAFASVDDVPSNMRFDLIAAFDVFEHMPQESLIPLFKALASKLQPEGVLLCRVPNGESPFGRVFQHGDLTHTCTLGLSKFKQIGGASGLRVQCVGEAPWHVTARNPKRVLREWLQWLLERTVAFAYRQNPRALSPNLVVAFNKTKG